MTLLLDERGEEVTEEQMPSNAACPKCERRKRELIRGFGRAWKQLCGHCGHMFASGTGEPPTEDA